MIDIVSSNHIRYAPGLSINYPGIVTINNAVFKNADWLGPLNSKNTDKSDYFSYSTEALPYIMKKQNKVLVLGAGTGDQVEQALNRNAEEIIAVEQDRALTSLLTEKADEVRFSPYNQKGVNLKSITPRTYLMKSESKFDLIVLPIIGSFGGSSGLFALQEQYILTKEAFNNMWQRLNDKGIISIITYIDYPYQKPIKILATIAEVLQDEGISELTNYIAAIKNWNTISIAIKKSKISTNESERIRKFCKKMNFDPVILPNINAEEQRRYNKLQDETFYMYIAQILSSHKDREKLYSQNAFNIKPATDDQPYFSQFLQWKSIPQMIELFGTESVPFFEIGYLLLYITFAQIVLLAIILIILPLFKLGWCGGNKVWSLIYFSGLGIGYMFIEIIFIQRFTLYFGNIVYSAAAVISLMLIASGVGSFVSQRYNAIYRNLMVVIGIIVLLLLIQLIFLSPILELTIGFDLLLKIIFTALLIIPVAFLMGFPFPIGLRLVSHANTAHVPWAWGINGSVSVISAVLAAIIAVELGFFWVMVFATTAYSLSLIISFKRV
ncbi:MAG: class I SAM-dependent methyltransferase [Ignavibacteriaceae bacterium]